MAVIVRLSELLLIGTILVFFLANVVRPTGMYFAIKTCKSNGQIVGHLPRKFLLDRGRCSCTGNPFHYALQEITFSTGRIGDCI